MVAQTWEKAVGLRIIVAALWGALFALVASPAGAQAPHFAAGEARQALIVDGEPFLVLGAQANNSSNYPDMLDRVWPMVERISANTLLMPVGWEQVEPVEGKF